MGYMEFNVGYVEAYRTAVEASQTAPEAARKIFAMLDAYGKGYVHYGELLAAHGGDHSGWLALMQVD